MSTKTISAPVLRAIAKRHYGSCAVKPLTCATSAIETTKTKNGSVVSSAECLNYGMAKIAVAVKAGSRYECADTLGISHVVRAAAGLSTKCLTSFKIAKTLQATGSHITASSDRETIIYTLDSKTEDLDDNLPILRAVVSEQVFKPWDLSDNIARLEVELAHIPPQARVLDLLHAAAYRKGLGNSIFASKHALKSLNSEAAQDFYNNCFNSDRVAYAGIGVDHGTMQDFACTFELENSKSSDAKSVYKGGEIRQENPSNTAYVAIACEGRGYNKKDVFTAAVLRYALGGPSAIGRAVGGGKLSKALCNIQGPATAQAISIAHSDSGLFGVVVAASPTFIRPAVEAAYGALVGGLCEADVERGKAQLKAAMLFESDSPTLLCHDVATQSLFLSSAKSPCELAAKIDEINPSQALELYKKMTKGGNFSMASVGRVYNVPYLDEL